MVRSWALLLLVGATLPSPAAAEDPRDTASDASDGVGFEGPLPADRQYDLDDLAGRGLWLGAEGEAGVLARDPHLGAVLKVGVEHRLAALHLRLPVRVRVWDLPPLGREYPEVPCRVLRCTPLVRDDATWGVGALLPAPLQTLEPLKLLTLVDEVRVGRASDVGHLRLAPLQHTLGRGSLVDGFRSEPFADRQGLAALATASVFGGAAGGELLVGDLTLPHALMAGRAFLRPERLIPGERGRWRTLFQHLEFALESAADVAGPGPLLGADIEVRWPVGGDLVEVAPFVTTGALYGLSPPGSGAPGVGAGATGGAKLRVAVPYVGFAVEAAGGAGTAGYRHGVFSSLYLLDRRAAAGPAANGGGLLGVPAPAGWHARVAAEVAVAGIARAGIRGRLDPAPGASSAEAFVDVALLGGRGALRVQKRGLDSGLLSPAPWSGPLLADDHPARALFAWDESVWGAAELAIPVWGPLAVFARWTHAVRLLDRGKVRADDDVMVGVSGDLRLDSHLLEM